MPEKLLSGGSFGHRSALLPITCALSVLLFVATVLPAAATTKGFNQVVTPDIQPQGQLSISVQQEDPSIGNRDQLQFELGVTKSFEVAMFQGTSPAEQIFGAELGLVHKGPFLVSTGVLNWTTKGTAPQPFLEAGYYAGNTQLVAGFQRGFVNAASVTPAGAGTGAGASSSTMRTPYQTQAIFGAAYNATSRLKIQLDYQSGESNFATCGFTYNITPTLQFNPSLYLSNSRPYKGYGYLVVTYTVTAFK